MLIIVRRSRIQAVYGRDNRKQAKVPLFIVVFSKGYGVAKKLIRSDSKRRVFKKKKEVRSDNNYNDIGSN